MLRFYRSISDKTESLKAILYLRKAGNMLNIHVKYTIRLLFLLLMLFKSMFAVLEYLMLSKGLESSESVFYNICQRILNSIFKVM